MQAGKFPGSLDPRCPARLGVTQFQQPDPFLGDIPELVRNVICQNALEGLNEIGLTLQEVDKIERFEDGQRASRPWLYAGASE